MTYPKSVMSRQELIKMGFKKEMLDRASRERGQTMAWKSNPKNVHSTMYFDTDALEKWRVNQAKLMNLEILDERRRT